MPMPMGSDNKAYEEVVVLMKHYAGKIVDGNLSYADLIRHLDRLAELRSKAKKLWGDQ